MIITDQCQAVVQGSNAGTHKTPKLVTARPESVGLTLCALRSAATPLRVCPQTAPSPPSGPRRAGRPPTAKIGPRGRGGVTRETGTTKIANCRLVRNLDNSARVPLIGSLNTQSAAPNALSALVENCS